MHPFWKLIIAVIPMTLDFLLAFNPGPVIPSFLNNIYFPLPKAASMKDHKHAVIWKNSRHVPSVGPDILHPRYRCPGVLLFRSKALYLVPVQDNDLVIRILRRTPNVLLFLLILRSGPWFEIAFFNPACRIHILVFCERKLLLDQNAVFQEVTLDFLLTKMST